jgi:hypothetical protein
MRFEDERYVRAYTRDTTNWLMLSWQARTVFLHLLRKFDRAGIFEIGNTRDPVSAVAAQTRLPREVVDEGLNGETGLLAGGELRYLPEHNVIFCPNFMAAQEAIQSNAGRQRAKRERAAARQRLLELGDTSRVGSDTSRVADDDDFDDQDAGPDDDETDTSRVATDTNVSDPTLCDTPILTNQLTSRSYLSGSPDPDHVDPTGSSSALRAGARARTRARTREGDASDRAAERLRRGDHPDGQFTPRASVPIASYRPSEHVLADARSAGLGFEGIELALADYQRVGRLREGSQADHDRRFGRFLAEAALKSGGGDEKHERAGRGNSKPNGGASNGAHGSDAQAGGRQWDARTQRSIARTKRFLDRKAPPGEDDRS